MGRITGDPDRDFSLDDPPDGSDTVRILPDRDEDDGGYDEEEAGLLNERHENRTSLRRGTIYTQEPQPQRPPIQHYMEPYEPAPNARALKKGSETTSSHPMRQAPPAESEDEGPQRDRDRERKQARGGPSACVILAGTFSFLAVACAVLAFATLRGGLDGLGRLGGIFPQFGLVTTPTVTIDTSSPTLISSIRALARLETVHYQLEKVVTGKSSGPLPDFLTSDKILLVAHGEVVAGIDLDKLREGDISVEGERVTIRLPEPEILYSRLDNDKTYVYDRQTGIFNKPDPNLESQIRSVAEGQITQAATEDGILEKARANGEDVVRTLVEGLGYEDVQFEP